MISKNRIRYYASLKDKKTREKEQRFLIEGVRLCEEILDSEYEVENVFYCPAKLISNRAQQLIQKFLQTKIPVEELDFKSLNRLSDTVHSQGIIGLVKMKEFSFKQFSDNHSKILVALDHINEPGNLGTLIRTANWFGVAGILLSQNSVDYMNQKALRASMGSVFHIPIIAKLNLNSKLSELKQMDYSLYAADVDGTSDYSTVEFSDKSVLILGNEVDGVSDDIKNLSTLALNIPRQGKGDSLNVAVAAGILLAEMSKNIHHNKRK